MNSADQKCLVLIAEDDLDDRLFMQDAFAEVEHHCELIFFTNGLPLLQYLDENMLSIYDDHTPCMIFLDLNMPQMNGKETLEKLRQQLLYHGIPIFILTTSNNEDDIISCYDLGANAFLQKPHEFAGFKSMLTGIYRHWMRFMKNPIQGAETTILTTLV